MEEEEQQPNQQQQQMVHPQQQQPAGNQDDDDDQMENVIPTELIDHPAILAFQISKASFLITDPTMPGNPIIYASHGFLDLTQYTIDRILGRNCRFLQGPETDPVAVAKMRESLDQGLDVSCIILNYRRDGTTFWNHILTSGVRDNQDRVKYFIGLQCPAKAPPCINHNPPDVLLSSSSSYSSLNGGGAGDGAGRAAAEEEEGEED